MKFLDCKDGTIINLEQIVDIDTDERKVSFTNGVEIGERRLFEWLRKNGYLCSHGERYNQPTQRAMELGLFEIKKTTINKPDGTTLVSTTTKVTGKGQIYFVDKFLRDAA